MIRLAVLLAIAGMLACAFVSPASADLSSKLGALEGNNLKGYLGPLPKAMSTTMNSGIFQSGYVPKAGFNLALSVQVTGASFEDKDRLFTPTDPFGFQPNTPTQVPTIVGNENAVAVPDNGGSTPVYPGGLNISQFLLPVPQLTIGTVMGTRATVRWFAMNFKDSDIGKIDFLGVGAQHSLSQYFPNLPVDLALGGFYQKLKIGDGLLDTKAMHFDVTASKRFGGIVKFEPFVSVGYDTYDMSVKYKFTGAGSPVGGDELTVDFDRLSNKHLAAGAQISLAVVKLHAEVVSAANTGAAFGLSFGL
jgi:hypothetical protein